MMLGWRFPKESLFPCILLVAAAAVSHPALAWGDGGHEIIALIAEHYLDPAARAKVATLLAADTDTLTNHDIASEATHWRGAHAAPWSRKISATSNAGRGTTAGGYASGRSLWLFFGFLRGCDNRSSGLSTPVPQRACRSRLR
jgi:hypothetical protein